MLADKSLLSVTLAATFVAGTVTGYAVRDVKGESPFAPNRAEHVFAKRLADLRERGYDKDEMAAAVKLHQAYLDEYGHWWGEFLDTYRGNFDLIDKSFEKNCADLDVTFRRRTGRTGEGR